MRMRAIVMTGFAGLVVVLSGCGNGPPTSGGGGGPKVGKAAPTGLGTPAVMVKATGGNVFDPSTVTAKVGQVIQWTNTGGVPHNVTFDEAADLTSPTVKQGDTWQVSFSVAGTYPFHCTFHDPTMVGTITVSG